ncbi:MAG: cytochrome P450 [Hyphomicrobium sp.]
MTSIATPSQRPFRPRTIVPPDKPLPLVPFLRATVRNPISAWSRLLYERPIISVKMLGQRFAYLCDPDDIRRVLVSEADDFPKAPVSRRVLEPALGDGIFTAEGAAWRWQRRAVAPIFRASDLGVYIPAMVRAAEATLDGWRASPSGSVQDVDEAMTATTLAIILDTMLSGAQGFDAAMVRENIERYLGPTSWLVAYDLAGVPGWMPYPRRRQLHEAGKTLRGRVSAVIARRHGERDRAASQDLLDRLIAARDPETGRAMSDENLVDTVLTFLLAGHETSAVALTWTLSLLAQSPEWQSRVVAEALAVIGDEPMTTEHLDRLVITEQVLKESMRLFPPAAILPRMAAKDCVLGGRAVTAGTHVAVPIYALHRHRLLWDDPDAFDPTRFAPEREAGRSKFAYMPFGAGPRVCIGAAFSMMEMKVVLATLLRCVRLSPSADPPPLPVLRVTLRPSPKVCLRVNFV